MKEISEQQLKQLNAATRAAEKNLLKENMVPAYQAVKDVREAVDEIKRENQ